MCVLPDKHWAAQRIPEGNFSVITGFYPITEINFSLKDDFMYSNGLKEFALNKGFYHPDVNAFNFRQIFSLPESVKSPHNKKRILNIINEISTSTIKEEDEIPFSIKPANKITLFSLKNLLRSHGMGAGKGIDKHKEDYYPVCSAENTYSVIMELRNWMPKELSSIMWFSPLKPCMQPYVPLYANINSIPNNFNRAKASDAYTEHNNNKGISAGRKNLFFSLYLYGKKIESNQAQLNSRLKFIREKEQSFEEQLQKKEGKIMDSYKRGLIITSLKKDITSFNLKLLSGAYR
jgi:dipeptidase